MEKNGNVNRDPEIENLFDEAKTQQTRKRKEKKPKKKMSRTAKIILFSVLGVLLLALIGLCVFAWHVCNRPNLFFETVTRVSTVETPGVTPLFVIEDYLPIEEPGTTRIPILFPTKAPESENGEEPEETIAPADPERLSGVVNVALFGIDAYEDGSTTSGSMPHTDANMIVAINFDTNEISLISIARDCLTTAPGHTGFYKFNGIFNVGGGMKDPYAGLELSCRAAEEWIGGVSIPYYYGVDFQAVIDLVDMIGGIDFDVDIRLYLMDGRQIAPGRRHLDGQGVMAYLRMRRSADGLDSSRTARQRKMLVAIFKKLKQEGKLAQVPDILKTLGKNVYTNATLTQTSALVNFASNIDPDSIQTYSIQGSMHANYEWRYCFIDQQARIDIIKKVYGITAEPMGVNSIAYEQFLHEHGFRAIQYMTIAKQIFAAVHEKGDANSMSESQKTAYAVCWKDYSDLKEIYDAADKWMRLHYDGQFTEQEQEQFAESMEAMKELETRLRASADALNGAFGKPVKAKWTHSLKDWYGKECLINDVYVDFR